MNETETVITQLVALSLGWVDKMREARARRCDCHCRGESRRGLRDHCDVKLERCGVEN